MEFLTVDWQNFFLDPPLEIVLNATLSPFLHYDEDIILLS